LKEIRVDDYYLDPPQKVRIELDPTLSPGDQIERRYQRAKRAERSGKQATERLERTQAEIALLEPLQNSCKSAETIAGVEVIEEQLPPRLKTRLQDRPKNSSGSKGPPRTRLPFVRYHNSKGQEFRVGRGARENDELTFRHARGNDVWMHVRGRPGAHVVICQPGTSPSSEILLLGAQLALAHSGLKEGAREEVSWTRVKEVHKTKGLPPGKVLLRSEKVLYVEAKRAELDGLQRD
jgi:predicted ribosome quality control (RQC) complex YloA/Tae2 family protein